jgi:putative transposase
MVARGSTVICVMPSVHRVARIMRENKLRAQIGYKRRYIKGGKLASVADNLLDRNFNPDTPNSSESPRLH